MRSENENFGLALRLTMLSVALGGVLADRTGR